MKNYINGVLYGIRISIRLYAKLKNENNFITVLCRIQTGLANKQFKNNVEVWQYVRKCSDG